MKELYVNTLNESTVVWFFNIGCENKWYNNFGDTHKMFDDDLLNIEHILLYVAKENDYLLLKQRPKQEILNYVESKGINLPNILIVDSSISNDFEKAILKDVNIIGTLRKLAVENAVIYPYGITETVSQIAHETNLKLFINNYHDAKYLSNKINQKTIVDKNDIPAPKYKITNIGKLDKDFDDLYNGDTLVLKDPLNASGKGIFQLRSKRALMPIIKLLEQSYNKDYEFILEEWKQSDFSLCVQYYIHKNLDYELMDFAIQQVKGTVYRGAITQGYNDLKKILSKKELDYYIKIIEHITDNYTYNGVIGFDSIYSTDDRLYPLIEINARSTMTSYLSNIRKKSEFSYAALFIIDFVRETNIDFITYCKLIDQMSFESISNFECYLASFSNVEKENSQYYRVLVIILSNDNIDSTSYEMIREELYNNFMS